MKRAIVSIVTAGLLVACGGGAPTPDIAVIQTQAAEDVVATLTAEAPIITPTHTLTPTNTAIATPTSTETAILSPSPTLSPTDTPTPTVEAEVAQVIRVIDGDTIEVELDGFTYRVRYIGMNTPEVDQSCGPEARAVNASLVEGQSVRLVKDISEMDRHGRLLRYVYVGDMFVNAELVRLGYASVTTYPPDVSHAQDLLELERQARGEGRGCFWQGATGSEEWEKQYQEEQEARIDYCYALCDAQCEGESNQWEYDDLIGVELNPWLICWEPCFFCCVGLQQQYCPTTSISTPTPTSTPTSIAGCPPSVGCIEVTNYCGSSIYFTIAGQMHTVEGSSTQVIELPPGRYTYTVSLGRPRYQDINDAITIEAGMIHGLAFSAVVD